MKIMKVCEVIIEFKYIKNLSEKRNPSESNNETIYWFMLEMKLDDSRLDLTLERPQ